MASSLSTSSPFSVRFFAYLHERFPLLNGLKVLILFTACYTLAAHFGAPDRPVVLYPKLLLGVVALWCFFFRLRVFDEHQDYKIDCRYHPDRILQSGLISLEQLRVVATLGLVIEAVASLWFHRMAFGWWLAALLYSILTALEFFANRPQEPLLFRHGLTRMLILPVLVLWIGSMAMPPGPLPQDLFLLGLLSFFTGMAQGICRKIKAPEEEIAGVPTYTELFGTRWAPVAAFNCLMISAAMLAYLLWQVTGNGLLLMAAPAMLLSCGIVMVRFIRRPTPARARQLEHSASLFMLAAYLLLTGVTLYQSGVQWQ